jgi:outer membrane protein OmpA-like peptidoglycan-associated protein
MTMRPLIIGIILFLAWLILSTWYYATHIYPVLNPADETTITETVPGTIEQPAEAPAPPDAPDGITLYFGFDKTEILNPGTLRDWLPRGREYLDAVADACVQIDGHTCNIGTEAYNMDLGRRRAESVQKFLLENGFSSECVRLSSKGEAQPAVANTSEENRKKNRRAELYIQQ